MNKHIFLGLCIAFTSLYSVYEDDQALEHHYPKYKALNDAIKEFDNEKVTRLMSESGACFTAIIYGTVFKKKDPEFMMPLHYAAKVGNSFALDLLIKNNSFGLYQLDIESGHTALHIAAQEGNYGSIVLLLRRMRDLNVNVITRGKTALDCAQMESIKRLLPEHGGKHAWELEEK